MKGLKRFVRDLVAEQYQVMDEIWKSRINYASVANYYDKDTVKAITQRMPNLLVKGKGSPLDEVAGDYGFESTCDLVDQLVNYENKSVVYERLLAQFEQSGEFQLCNE